MTVKFNWLIALRHKLPQCNWLFFCTVLYVGPSLHVDLGSTYSLKSLVDSRVKSSQTLFSPNSFSFFLSFSFFSLFGLLKHLIKYLEYNVSYRLFKHEYKPISDKHCMIKAVVRYGASEQIMACYSEIPAQNLLTHTWSSGTIHTKTGKSMTARLWLFSWSHSGHSCHSQECLLLFRW